MGKTVKIYFISVLALLFYTSAQADVVDLGEKIFNDVGLSEPTGTSCASCHDPDHAYAGNHGSTNGVALGSRPGAYAKRNTPSVLYLRYTPPFFFKWEEDAKVPDPHGGFFWDGRADTIALAVQQPLLNLNEMGNLDAKSVMKKIQASHYAADFNEFYPEAQEDPQRTMSALGEALHAFLTSDKMTPFSSKYDSYIRGDAKFSPVEAQGLALFKNPTKGNCVACHLMMDSSPDPRRSLFTDFGLENAGIPRNSKLAQNNVATFFDLGLCDATSDPIRRDPTHCGQFKTPSLRNVAVREYFMHNGRFTTLKQAVTFYATRDTNPATWYPNGISFDDVPDSYRQYVNTITPPYTRTVGKPPALNEEEIDTIVAFLKTLTDAKYQGAIR